MLVYGKHEQGENTRECDIRKDMTNALTYLNFAKRLWILFKSLLSDTLADFTDEIGQTKINKISNAMEKKVQAFFVQALQLDQFTL